MLLDVLGAKDVHPFYFHHALEGIGGQVALVCLDGFEAYGTDVVKRFGEAGGGDIVGGACLELEGQVVEGGMLEADGLYHFSSAHVGRDAVEPFLFSVEDAYSCRAVYLVAAEGEEVTVELLHVDGHVGCALGSVDEDRNVVFVGNTDDVVDGIDGAQDVADVCDADDSGMLVEELLVLVHTKAAIVRDGNHAQTDALTGLEELPGDDVAVVLHLRDDDFVAFLHEGLSEARCHEVDALGGAARKDNLGRAAGIQETANRLARSLVQLGGLLREEMHATMHVGIYVIVLLRHRLNDLPRLLCRSGIIEIDEGVLAVEDLVENGERPSPSLP